MKGQGIAAVPCLFFTIVPFNNRLQAYNGQLRPIGQQCILLLVVGQIRFHMLSGFLYKVLVLFSI